MSGIVVLGAAHAPLLAAVHESAFEPGDRWDEAAIGSLLATPGSFAVASADGTAMAMFRVAADEAELLTLAVDPGARRLGAARRLLDRGAAMTAERGAAMLFLEVSVRNAPALALYRSAGFAETGRRRRYYADGADAVLMARALTAPRPCGSPAS